MLRAAVIAAIVACSPRVIELGTTDSPPCACRLRCSATTIDCLMLGSASTCGSDHFCTGSFGSCTASVGPCAGSAAQSVCTASETSTQTCQ
jgi:hypothetical protein